VVYGWHGGTLKKYRRQVEALKNGQLTLSLFGPFFGWALFEPPFLILGPWAKPLGGPDPDLDYLCRL